MAMSSIFTTLKTAGESRNGSLLRRRKRPNGERQKLNTDRSLAAL